MVFGIGPEEGQVFGQDIYLDIKGRVSIKSYKYTRQVGTKNMERCDFKIGIRETFKIFYEFKKYFECKFDPFELMIMDAGSWDAVIENTAGEKYSFNGPLIKNYHKDLDYLSTLIRASLGRRDLFVFNGDAKTDRIKKIAINYSRTTEDPIN